jgi:hypothetical protein
METNDASKMNDKDKIPEKGRSALVNTAMCIGMLILLALIALLLNWLVN